MLCLISSRKVSVAAQGFTTTMEWILYLVLGTVAGFLSGLLGVGGGTIMVPTLYFLFKYYLHLPQSLVMHMAVGTSLAIVMINATISTTAHNRKKNLLWDVFLKMIFGLMLGATAASFIVNFIPGKVLHLLFIFFLTVSAIQVFFSLKPKHHIETTSAWTSTIAGFIISFFASLLGIGGSIISTPYFLCCNIEMKKCVALAASCGLALSFVATIGFIFAGHHQPYRPHLSLGYVYLPAVISIAAGAIFSAPAGAATAIKLPNKLLRIIFFCFLVFIAGSMLIDYLLTN